MIGQAKGFHMALVETGIIIFVKDDTAGDNAKGKAKHKAKSKAKV